MIAVVAAAMLAVQATGIPAEAATAKPAANPAEIARAIDADRLEQARQMLADAAVAGDEVPVIARLHADLAFAQKDWAEALARYADISNRDLENGRSAERAGIASIMLADNPTAARFVDRAIASGSESWRAWNAKAVLCDFAGDWSCADEAFNKAAAMGPEEPEILNNRGWSLLLRGAWANALPMLERAVAGDPKSKRARNNLELAKAALADNLPQRRPGESDMNFAARLNDAGVVAAQRGERDRAIAAFSRALETRESWFPRAANNLAAVKK